MPVTVTVRQLRNDFPAVKRLIDRDGEVVVTDRGTPKYRLTRTLAPDRPAPAPKDYLARLKRHQPRPLSAREARVLHDHNRGER
jgi:hypothetical protein